MRASFPPEGAGHPTPSSLSSAGMGADFARRTKTFRAWSSGACVAVVIALAWGALWSPPGQALDTLVMYSFQEHVPLLQTANLILHSMVSIPVLLVLSAIILAAILFRRRYALLWRSALVLIVANGATQVMKELLDRPDLGVGHTLANSFPSGHVTLAVSVSLILAYAVPSRWRVVGSLLAWIAVVSVSVSVLTAGWHRLSDVIAAILVATASALILLPAQWRPFEDRFRGRDLGAFAWFVLVVTIIAGAVLTWRIRGDLGSPVSAGMLTSLAEDPGVGLPFTAVGLLAIVSVATLSVRGVDRLAGN